MSSKRVTKASQNIEMSPQQSPSYDFDLIWVDWEGIGYINMQIFQKFLRLAIFYSNYRGIWVPPCSPMSSMLEDNQRPKLLQLSNVQISVWKVFIAAVINLTIKIHLWSFWAKFTPPWTPIEHPNISDIDPIH